MSLVLIDLECYPRSCKFGDAVYGQREAPIMQYVIRLVPF